MDGECIYEIFKLVAENPTPETPSIDLPPSRLKQCCGDFSLKVLADTVDDDQFRNDKSGFLFWFNDVISSAILKLQKHSESVGDYVDLVTLSDNTYGTNYSYGFFINEQNEKFVGYQLEWRNVLDLHGEGGYRIKCEASVGFGGSGEFFSPNFCLKTYSADRANGSVKIEYYLNHILGSNEDDKKIKDLGELNWYNAYRLPGWFGFPSSTYKSEYIKYNNGQQVWVEDEQDIEYQMALKNIPAYMHDIFRTDIFMSDNVMITDYNTNNPHSFVKKEVIKSSDYSPKWNILKSKLSSIDLKWKQFYNNHKKLRS